MNISFENPDKINGVLTLTIDKEDYEKDVEKQLKAYRKKANVPGFRPGTAPMGMIKRQVGDSVKLDVIDKLINDSIYKYVQDNKIQMLGNPLPDKEKQVEQDITKDGPFTFVFDIAVAPEFDVALTENDTIDYYTIDVDDKLIDQQVEMFQSRGGHYDKVDAYNPEERDMLKGDLRELGPDGADKADAIVVEDAVMMPEYIKVDEQKELFKDAKPGSVITFNPKKAYPDNNTEIMSLLKIEKEQAENLTSDFTYLVKEITRFKKAELNQELFDQVFGKDEVKDEKQFREKIAEGIKSQLANDQDYEFLMEVRQYLENKIGDVKFPEELLKRVLEESNKDKKGEINDEEFKGSLKQLEWDLIKNKLNEAFKVKIDDNDVKDVARQVTRIQFAQYGMSNVPEEYIEQYATQMLKDKNNINNLVERAIEEKLTKEIKKVVKLNEKSISLEDFNKKVQEF